MNKQQKTFPALLLALSLGGSCSMSASTPLAHRYSFSQGGTDSVGNAHLTLVGAAIVDGGKLHLPGQGVRLHHAKAEGASLATLAATITQSESITIEGWFSQSAAQYFSKVFMAGQGVGSRYMDFTPRRSQDGNVSSICISSRSEAEKRVYGGVVRVEVGGTVTLNSPLQVYTNYYFAAVWNGTTGMLELSIGQVGGVLSKYSAPMGGHRLSELNITEFYLGSAVQFPDQDFFGEIDEFRIWKGALASSDIGSHFVLGPDSLPAAAPEVVQLSATSNGNVLALNATGLVLGTNYHVQSSIDLETFLPVPGLGFVATGTTRQFEIPIDSTGQGKRFFRLAVGPAPGS